MKRYKLFFKEMSEPNISFIRSSVKKEIDEAKKRLRSNRDMKDYYRAYIDYLAAYDNNDISPVEVAEKAKDRLDIHDDSEDAAEIQAAQFIIQVVRKAIESVQVKRYNRFYE